MYLCTKENIMHHPEIAIVDPNTLTCLGLKTFGRYHSNGYYPCIPSFGELTDDTPDMYAHYFISAQSILNILPSFYFVNQNNCISRR